MNKIEKFEWSSIVVTLPHESTLENGIYFHIKNNSSSTISIHEKEGSALTDLPGNKEVYIFFNGKKRLKRRKKSINC